MAISVEIITLSLKMDRKTTRYTANLSTTILTRPKPNRIPMARPKEKPSLQDNRRKEEKALDMFYNLAADRGYTYTKHWLERYGKIIGHLIAIKPTLKTKEIKANLK